MSRAVPLLLLALLAGPARGEGLPSDHFKPAPPAPPAGPEAPPAPVERPQVTSREGTLAVLRGLDKMTGRITTLELGVGESLIWERLEIRLEACRLPGPGEPEDAFAWLAIRDLRRPEPAFAGWMFASSPALSALDHPRYDVWVIACRITE